MWGTGVLRTVVPDAIPRADAIGIDTTTLLFAAALSIGSTVLFGSLPALRSMAPDLSGLLNSAAASRYRDRRRAAAARADGRSVEVALAVVLLVSAGLMVRSFARLSEVDPGFRQDDV